MDFNKLIGENLAKPRGLFGVIVGFFMDIRNKSINKWTIDLMEIKPSDKVLEIGYGTGATIKNISTVAKYGLTVGIDYSETMFRKASRVNAKAIYKGSVTLFTGDASNIPYPDEYFDKVCSIHCIYFWSEPEKILRETWRVLRNGGKIIISVDSKEELSRVKRTKDFTLYTPEELTDLLKKVGFKTVWIETHSNGISLCAIGMK
jgi:ubiquinone/menaquinone biosynthesis C-methylase UbiE